MRADKPREVIMKILILLMTTILIQSCDSDQRSRILDVDQSTVDPATFTTPDAGFPIADPAAGPVILNPTTDPLIAVNLEPGFENCDISYRFNGGFNIGTFALCQSSLQSANFRLRMAQSDLSVGTCFVPLHINNDGSSFKLGIAECVHNQQGTIYPMILTTDQTLTIDPQTGQNYELNGVMVIKAGDAVARFFDCLGARDNFLQSYFQSTPNCEFNQQCVAQGNNLANNFANNICSQFVGNYNDSYLQVRF